MELVTSPLCTLIRSGMRSGQLRHVGDHPDHAMATGQRFEPLYRQVQRLGVERTEALVEEQRLQRDDAAAVRQSGQVFGQRKRQREAREEGLAARKRLHRAALVAIEAIDDRELVRLGDQLVAPAGELREVMRGVRGE